MSALRYVGSKHKMLGTIELIVSKIKFKQYVWVEPFCGSLSVPLFFMNNTKITHFYLNDANPHLIRFYKTFQTIQPGGDNNCISNRLKSLYDKFLQNPRSYYDIRKKFNDYHHNMSDYDFIATFYFINRSCFSGLQSYNYKGEFNVSAGKPLVNIDELNKQLSNFHSLIYLSKKKVTFYNMDFIPFINKMKKQLKQTSSFYYCDPPYDESRVKYTRNNFYSENQKDLARLLSTVNNPFMTHNNNTANIRAIYSQYKHHLTPVLRLLGRIPSSRGRTDEIIITNF
jgi:DNA adenine methylase Dam